MSVLTWYHRSLRGLAAYSLHSKHQSLQGHPSLPSEPEVIAEHLTVCWSCLYCWRLPSLLITSWRLHERLLKNRSLCGESQNSYGFLTSLPLIGASLTLLGWRSVSGSFWRAIRFTLWTHCSPRYRLAHSICVKRIMSYGPCSGLSAVAGISRNFDPNHELLKPTLKEESTVQLSLV